MRAARENKKRRGAASPPSDAAKHALAILALCAATFLVYSNSFNSGFVLDNRVLLLDPRITAATAENVRLILTKDYWYGLSATGLYRPLSSLSYLLNYAVLENGAQPSGYHWVNAALHALNVSLVYALGLLIFARREKAAALAALWGLHPILTESVTNIIGRADLLSAFGVLAGLLCHAMASRADGRRRIQWLVGLLAAATIGIFSKESGVALPAAMLIYDAAFRGKAHWRARAPGYLVVILPLAAFWYARSRALAGVAGMQIAFTENPLVGADFWTARLTAVKVLGKYLWLLAWPGSLSCDHSYNQVSLGADWQAPAALVVCLAALAAAVPGYRRRQPIFFFIAFFFATLAPTSNLLILIGSIMAERFLYLPSIGFAGCVVAVVYAACVRMPVRHAAAAVVGAICLAYAVRGYVRNFDWLDDRTLWTSAVQAAPASYKAHMALASALAGGNGAGLEGSIHEIEQSFAILKPLPDERNTPQPYIDGGTYYGQQGEISGDAGWFQKSLETLLRAERIEDANNRENRRQALRRGESYRDTGWYELYLSLGGVYLRLSEPRKALEALEHGRKLKPVAEFFTKQSQAYFALGDLGQASVHLMEAAFIDTADARLAGGLADLYRRRDPAGCAVRTGGNQISLNMDCPIVRDDACSASADLARLYREIGMEQAAGERRATALAGYHCPAAIFDRAE